MLVVARLALLIVLSASTARAESRIAIVETRGGVSLPALGTQVRLHVGAAVSIVKVQLPEGPIAPQAQSLRAAHDAMLIVWIEPVDPDGDRAFVVYVAGPVPDRALTELVRFEGSTPASEIERTIALKVVGLLDSILIARPTSPLGTRIVSGRPSWLALLGATVVAGDWLSAGPASSIGYRFALGRVELTGSARARWIRSASISGSLATTSIDEVSVAARGELAMHVGRIAPFAAGGIGGSYVRARAITSDGRAGAGGAFVPQLDVGVGLTAALSRGTHVTVAIGVERALIRQRFLVDRVAVADLGRDRIIVLAGISVVLR